MASRVPEGFTPPYPAWAGQFFDPDSTYIVARFGVQSPQPGGNAEMLARIRDSFALPDGPRHVDRAWFADAAGWHNALFMAYWDDPSAFSDWTEQGAVRDWQRCQAPGLWMEVMALPVQRLETLYSCPNHAAGLSHVTPALAETPTHAYWGAMRDRIPAAQGDALASSLGEALPQPAQRETRGRRLRVKAPANLCVIRSAQDWGACGEAERSSYLESVAPVLERGTLGLRDPATGCCAAQLLRETTLDGEALDKTCVTAFFLSLAHLERWAETHPEHLAIFGSFMQMVQKHEARLDLKLWHEVAVLPEGALHAEYVDCHPGTGLLPWFEAEPA